jgi:hypothetical protein
MREDCRHYESRTYASGESVRKCRLDLAPEAPWRCPDDCPSYDRRTFDAGWQYGSLRGKPAPRSQEPMADDVAALLDEAEDIVNRAAPEVIADFEPNKKRRFRKGKKKK